MKKLIILFFFPVFCFGQTSHFLDSTISYEYDTMNVLNLHEKVNYGFDANNNLTLVTNYSWDTMTSSWIGTYKYESIYDANNNQTSLAFYSWDTITSSWVGTYKTEYTYDANNNQTLLAYYTWDTITSSWVGTTKYEYTYDANNNQTLLAYYIWDTITSSWVGTYKYEYTYDANNNQTAQTYYTWDTNTTLWIVSFDCESDFNLSSLTINAYPGGSNWSWGTYNAHQGFLMEMYSIFPGQNIPFYTTCRWWTDSTVFYYSNASSTSIEDDIEKPSENRKLLYIKDILGKSTKAIRNKPLFYIYDDGTVEKKIIIE